MEEFEKHIIDERKTCENNGIKTSYCGEKIGSLEFYFISINHAIIMAKGRLIPCKNCAKAIEKILKLNY